MIYEVWTDADNKLHALYEMDEQYINNCINQIERVCKNYGIRKTDGYASDFVGEFKPLTREWCINYANGYLKAFKEELSSR